MFLGAPNQTQSMLENKTQTIDDFSRSKLSLSFLSLFFFGKEYIPIMTQSHIQGVH